MAVVLGFGRRAAASPVIPPGQDAVVGALVGAGQPDVGGCRLVSAEVEKVRIEVTYDCSGAPVGVVLHHASAAVPALARSEQFVIAALPGAGAPPPALVAAVLERARQHERRFQWLGAESGERLTVPPPGRVAPSLVVAAVGLFALAAAGLVRAWRRRERARAAAVGGAVAAVAAGLGALRWYLVPHTYFHQNGQGPLWIDYVVGGTDGGGYGPGHAELFAHAARAVVGDPEAGVFAAQAALGGLALIGVWVACRARGAGPLLAGAAVLVVGLDPWVARAAQSESYFGSCTSLLFLAAAALAAGSVRPRWRTLPFGLAVLAAGSLAGHAAKIHPIAWVPAAHLPLVVLAGRGRLRRRVEAAVVATIGLGAVAAAFAHGTIAAVLGGRLGAQWMPQVAGSVTGGVLRVALFALALGLVAALARGAWRGPLAALLVLAVVVTGAVAARYVGAPAPWIDAAQPRTFLPHLIVACVALAPFVSVAGRWRGPVRRGAPVALALAAVAAGAAQLGAARELPTDVLESEWLRASRADLPPSSRVAYVGRAEKRVLFLPLYGAASGGARSHPLTAGGELRLPGTGKLYYLRGSLCSSPEGASTCAALERRLSLRPVRERTLPARPSMVWFRYLEPEVRVTLYEAEPH